MQRGKASLHFFSIVVVELEIWRGKEDTGFR